MPKHPSPYEQGVRDGLLLPVIINLEETMTDQDGAHDILKHARKCLRTSHNTTGGAEQKMVGAQQATAAALISIAESLEKVTTMKEWELEDQRRQREIA